MDWKIGPTLGRGSSATVSLATCRHTGNTYAIKHAELKYSESLQHEQQILSCLNSPHIVTYKGFEITTQGDKVLYNLLLEHILHGALSNQICRFDEPTIRYYAREIAKGLNYLHKIGLAHCDIKGSNILVGDSGVKIADFGCAKWIEKSKTGVSISGTPAYMAPEVARGEEQGLPADIWSLGCTIIEIATGVAPWADACDPLSILYLVGFSGRLPKIPTFLSDEGKDFLRNCLRDSAERWTVQELLKHPFLMDSDMKPIQRSHLNSPTSVIEFLGNRTSTGLPDFQVGRIRKLTSFYEMPSWAGEEWVTVRSHD